MKLDHRSHIFQNLNGASGKYCGDIYDQIYRIWSLFFLEEVELKFLEDKTVAFNSLYDTYAAVYHGNGPSKVTGYRISFCKYLNISSFAAVPKLLSQ